MAWTTTAGKVGGAAVVGAVEVAGGAVVDVEVDVVVVEEERLCSAEGDEQAPVTSVSAARADAAKVRRPAGSATPVTR